MFRSFRSAKPFLPLLLAIAIAELVPAQDTKATAPQPAVIAAIEHRIALGAAAMHDGLAREARPTVAIERYHDAANAYAAAASEALAAHPPQAWQGQVASLLQVARDGRNEALLDAAGLEVARTNFVAALRDVDSVLVADPKNAEARQLRNSALTAMAWPVWYPGSGAFGQFPVFIPLRAPGQHSRNAPHRA